MNRGTNTKRRLGIAATVSLAAACAPGAPVSPGPGPVSGPPALQREFRGVWVASVSNIDWPSRPGLPPDSQRAELLAILDRSAALGLNAVILQVRPAGDALYASTLEPWSEYLTGKMGRAPEPFYDPLRFAIEEAHVRGLELHAWFNPYRARHPSAESAISAGHISRARPELVVEYGEHLWMDPGQPAVQEHSIDVILDVVRRYDVDGIHIDDYFYPYRERDSTGALIPFPDDGSWERYVAGGGMLDRDDWRRHNVDEFVRRLYLAIKDEKPAVRFGVSPIGIWRPGHPVGACCFDAYESIYADARKWLTEGWLDYFVPQLYRPIADTLMSYPLMLGWWAEQNRMDRHLWPGLIPSRVRTPTRAGGWAPEEIARQVLVARGHPGASGHIHFSARALMGEPNPIVDALAARAYRAPALPPASPWLDDDPPAPPVASLEPAAPADPGGTAGGLRLRLRPGDDETPAWWVVRERRGGEWSLDVVPGARDAVSLAGSSPLEAVAVSAVDRVGNESALHRLQPAGAAVVAAAGADAPADVPARADRWVERTLAGMTLREKVGQLVVPWLGGDYLPLDSEAYDRLRSWIVEDGIGGVVISIGAPLEMAAKLNALQALAPVPLLVAADMEHGPGQRLTGGVVMPYGLELGGGTEFPPVMGLGAAGDPRLAYEMGRITALEARAVGIHMIYAPVVDVNNDPGNPIINTRSYGEDPEAVARMAAAQIRGLQEHGVIGTAKHFPGHGDTDTDSHIALPVIPHDRARADSVELVPFRGAIDAGVGAVMSAHIAFPALTGDSVPATLSSPLLTGLLQDELGFDGLVITDALDMGGIVTRYGRDAAVRAIEAGADILLMPPDVRTAIDAVVAAVEHGNVTEARIDRSVRKLLRAKAGLGLHRDRAVDLAVVPAVVGVRPHKDIATEAAERSITVARDRAGLLPIRASDSLRVLTVVYADDADPLAGRVFRRELEARFPRLRSTLIDAAARPDELDELLRAADSADVVIFAPFVRVLAWKGDVAIAEPVSAFVRALAARRPTVVVSFGNPYVLTEFPEVDTYVLAWGPENVLQRAAARGLVGEIPMTGRLPIAIPPLLPLGAGIRVEAVAPVATPDEAW